MACKFIHAKKVGSEKYSEFIKYGTESDTFAYMCVAATFYNRTLLA